jgi:hypothetical protein
MARQHPFFFAKRFLPARVFESPDAVFRGLRSPRRAEQLASWWEEAGEQVDSTIELLEVGQHSEASPRRVHQLAVVGARDVGGVEVVVLSMPPALEANEAFYLALVRRAGEPPRVYFYERCLDDGEAVLASVADLSSRTNHGFFVGVELEDFTRELGHILGISLYGLEHSLSEPAARGATPRTAVLERVLVCGAALPWVLWALIRTPLSFTAYRYGPMLSMLYLVASLVLLVRWMRGAAAELITSKSFDQGAVVWAWLVPGLNLAGPPLVMRSLWRETRNGSPGWIALWWPVFVLHGYLSLAHAFIVHIDMGGYPIYFPGVGLLLWPLSLLSLISPSLSFGLSYSLFACVPGAAAYLGLLYLVRGVERARYS